MLAAAAPALAWRALRGDELRALPREIALPAAAFFAFALLLAPVGRRRRGRHQPAAVLHASVRRPARHGARAPTIRTGCRAALAGVALALASIFAAVGLWQAATHKLFFYAPNLAVSNANTDYFRVTSLFGDPSLYGRHVVLGIGVALTLLATRRWRTWPLIGADRAHVGRLLFSYSQSSMVALLVVTLALAVATGDARIRRGVAVLAAAALAGRCAYVAVKVVGRRVLEQGHQ